jgi:hypothetical protein
MNAIISIHEKDSTYAWVASPNEQYEEPPANAISWVSGDTEEALLQAAKDKVDAFGFTILESTVKEKTPERTPDRREVTFKVSPRKDVSSITVGQSRLSRVDLAQGVRH